jgi:restriction endonuclease Mrr
MLYAGAWRRNAGVVAELMIRHNVGVRIADTLHLKKIDEDFFLDD